MDPMVYLTKLVLVVSRTKNRFAGCTQKISNLRNQLDSEIIESNFDKVTGQIQGAGNMKWD